MQNLYINLCKNSNFLIFSVYKTKLYKCYFIIYFLKLFEIANHKISL